MTAFPGSPRLLKGPLVGIDPFNLLASVIVFQYDWIRCPAGGRCSHCL
jgi:hypothetical protein